MKNDILTHLDDATRLEQMYRANKQKFKSDFAEAYPQLKGSAMADFWAARLNYSTDDISWGSGSELQFVIAASLTAGLIAKIPAMFPIDEEFFYPRNIGFIVFPLLMAYFGWQNKLSIAKLAFIAVMTLTGLLFINLLPASDDSDTLALSCIHLVLFLWSVLGFAYVGSSRRDLRISFLKYNGDLVVISALILIAGGIMTGITIGLFSIIGVSIAQFYFEYVVVFGVAAVPIVGTWLIRTNPQLVGKVSPVIAKLFSPLVLVMLVIYLIAITTSGKDPHTDREFLMIFNLLLLGVMAIIFFSVAEASGRRKSNFEAIVLLLLSIVTIIVNSVALSAILFRISEWGITPNRAAVMGANVLILINLLLVAAQLFRVLNKKEDIGGVGRIISFYLPVYCIWTIIVTFIFPFLFAYE